MIVRFSTSMLPQKFVKQHFYFVLPAGVLFTAKTPGCKTIKNKRCLQMLESIPKLAVGRPKKPVGYFVDTPRHLQDINKQKNTWSKKTNRDKNSPRMIQWTLSPFTSQNGQDRGRHSFGHNSPTARARELFKPSTDATSLVVKIEKKNFCFGFEIFWGECYK